MEPLSVSPMSKEKKPAKPRILIVTPEITYLPPGMGNMTQRMSAKAGGLGGCFRLAGLGPV